MRMMKTRGMYTYAPRKYYSKYSKRSKAINDILERTEDGDTRGLHPRTPAPVSNTTAQPGNVIRRRAPST